MGRSGSQGKAAPRRKTKRAAASPEIDGVEVVSPRRPGVGRAALQEHFERGAEPSNALEVAIGHEVRSFRRKQNLTVVELAQLARLSPGMLSKIEHGTASPSLVTLRALSAALHVPVTAFFRRYEEERDVTFVRAGEGLTIERRGTRLGHRYQLLGHTTGKRAVVEPYLITLTEASDVFPLFRHAGMEFIYMLSGEMRYRHGTKGFVLRPGDSLFFDADAPHGPDELHHYPIRFLSITAYTRDLDE